MGIDELKISIINYIAHFTMYDYMAFAWLILIFFISLILAIALAKRSVFFALFILFISLSFLFIGPFTIKSYLDQYLRATESKTTMIKKLNFSDALIVEGDVKNISKNQFSVCFVNISILKIDESYIYNLINKLKPFKNMSISIDKLIDVNTSESFRVVFDGYTYKEDVNVSVNSQCY